MSTAGPESKDPPATPLESGETPKEGQQNVKKAVQTLDFKTVGSDRLGLEPQLNLTERIHLMLDRECTPVLYVYFAAIAILIVITAGIIVIVGLQCNWNFVE